MSLTLFKYPEFVTKILQDNYGYADGYYMCSTNNDTQLFVYALTGVAESEALGLHLFKTTTDVLILMRMNSF